MSHDPTALCLVFRIAGEHIAIRSADVQKVTPRPHLSRLPRLPPEMLGIAQHRGRVITVVDLARALFGSTASTSTSSARPEERLLILERPARHLGLLVDAVEEIETLHLPADLPEGPSVALRLAHRKGRALPVVDVERLARILGVSETHR